jgi:hypothetical protein
MRDYRRCSGAKDARDRQERHALSLKLMHVGNPLPRKLASSRKSRQFVFLYSHVCKVHVHLAIVLCTSVVAFFH